MRGWGNHRPPRTRDRDRPDSQRFQDRRLRRACLLARPLQCDRLDRRRSPKGRGSLSRREMISRNRAGAAIDEQAMNEAILNPRARQRRRSHREESGADSEYASIVAELRQLRAASQLSRYRGAAPSLPSGGAISDIVGGFFAALSPRHFGPPGLDAEMPMRSWLGRLQKRCRRSSMRSNWRWPSSRRTHAMRPMRTLDRQLRSRAPLPRLCRRYAPPSIRTSAPLSRTIPRRRASTKLSFAFPGSLRSCATAWRMTSAGLAHLCWRGSSRKSLTRWLASTSTLALGLEKVSSSPPARAS